MLRSLPLLAAAASVRAYNETNNETVTYNWGSGTSFCSSSLDEKVSGPTTADECWDACVDEYGDSIVSIDFENDEECWCQDSCPCMEEPEEPQDTTRYP